jgi:AcrR family transcriptional regulator
MIQKVRNSSGRGRQRRASSEGILEAILAAASEEFSTLGFEAASTRRIAERAGVFQAQLGYHVGSKAELWVATVDRLFARLQAAVVAAIPDDHDVAVADPAAAFAGVVRAHVRYTSENPQLPRIMMLEAATETERVQYLLDQHVRPVFALLELVWAEVRASGRGVDVDAAWVFMTMVGLGPLPFVQAPFLEPLLGPAAADPDEHADRVIRLLLPELLPLDVRGLA